MVTAAVQRCVSRPCRNHRQTKGIWQCVRCQGIFCQGCIKERTMQGSAFQVCNVCGDRLEDLRVQDAAAAPKASFYELLPTVFAYPVKGRGLLMLVLGWVVFGTLRLLSFSFFGKAAAILGAGYLAAWLFKIVNETALGKDEIADWPEFTELYSDVIDPLRRVLVATLVSLGPGVLCLLLGCFVNPLLLLLSAPFFVVGVVYYPMALLATAMHTTMALSPHAIFYSIGRVPGPYAVTCLFFFAIAAVLGVGELLLGFSLPVIGPLLTYALSLYLSLLEARVLGLLYRTNAARLGWFS